MVYSIHGFYFTSGDTLYLEVLGIAGQQGEWESFTKDIADKWMKMELNGKAPVPHWAKQWSYLNDIERHIHEVTKSSQPHPANLKICSRKLLRHAINFWQQIVYTTHERIWNDRYIKINKTLLILPKLAQIWNLNSICYDSRN